MLFLFAFSITPKKLLHDVIANHRDKVTSSVNPDITQIGKSGFNCNCENLVAESPFTGDVNHVEFLQHNSFSVYQFCIPSGVYTSTHFSFTLRGPPAVA